MANILEFVNQSANPRETMERLEKTWKHGVKVINACRIDKDFFVFGDGKISEVIPWEDVERIEMHIDSTEGERDMYFNKRYNHS